MSLCCSGRWKIVTMVEPDLSWVIHSYHWAPPLRFAEKAEESHAEELQKPLQYYHADVSNASTQALACQSKSLVEIHRDCDCLHAACKHKICLRARFYCPFIPCLMIKLWYSVFVWYFSYFRELLGKSGKTKLAVFPEPGDCWLCRRKCTYTNSIRRLIWKE